MSKDYAKTVVKNVGANRPTRDSVDKRLVNDFLNGTGRIIEDISVADYPIFESLPAAEDSDNDGMADEWEMTNFKNLSQASHEDFDQNGYTNIEEYLYFLTL